MLTRSEAVRRFHLMASRIGDLIVLGDRDTVFGELDAESEALPAEYGPRFAARGKCTDSDPPYPLSNSFCRMISASIKTWSTGPTNKPVAQV